MSTTEAATLEPVTIAADPRRAPLYARLWRGVPRELLFLLLGYPIALAGFVVSISLFFTGFGTLVTFVGIFVIVGTFYVARGFGLLELQRLDWAGQPRIGRPEWQDARARRGFWQWLRGIFGNGHYWLYLLHTMVLNFAISLFSWIVTIVWISVALGGASYWFWAYYLPPEGRQWSFSSWLATRDGFSDYGSATANIVIYTVLGVVMLAALPFVTRGLTVMHWGVARALLGPFRSDALQREVIALGVSRSAAVSAEGTALRRLERDIHDGPEQRLVRMQMDLASADRQLDQDPEKARALIAEAMQQSKDALEELRALSRGFAPPILMDRGLVAALESLAVRSAVPVTVQNDLGDVTLPQEIERNAYFIATELLTNVAKHADASAAVARIEIRIAPAADPAQAATTWLDLTVSDDGAGGAERAASHGLAGIDERLSGLGGTLELTSPAGGPTVAVAHLPVPTV